MKIVIGAVLLAGIALAFPITRDEISWRWATLENETASYESYVKAWPDGRHLAEAKARHDARSWAEAEATNTIPAYERYVKNHGQGKHVAAAKDKVDYLRWQEFAAANTVGGYELYLALHGDGKFAAKARDNIESLRWQQATSTNTIKSYETYASTYPRGRYLQEAQAKVSALRTDDGPFEAALKAGTEARLKGFLEEFPGHRKTADASQAFKDITEGRDIFDLLAEKKIEITTSGSGIQSVSVRLRRLASHPITVRVPVGTYFVSARQSAQNMVTTAESRIRLTGSDWQNISVPAACANRPREIPGSSDTFTVQRSPHQKELARLMPVLQKATVGYATRQAAVWIVTDNASYADLGVLVSRPSFQSIGARPGGGARMIKEAETARAMRICEEAGIDITRRRIWSDRRIVLQGLADPGLKTWLESKK
jgi:hypothetical protein